MAVIFKGCAPQNFRPGRHGFEPEAIVIHIIVGSQTSCDNIFLNPHLDMPRSAHYSVSKAGEIHQYVQETDTAFHAGIVVAPTWSLIKAPQPGKYINPNYYTIGIEHEGFPDDEWPDAQYTASKDLIAAIIGRFPKITADRKHIVMHREIRADKSCPGFKVDMLRLIPGAAPGDAQPTVSRSLFVTALANLNVRLGAPSTAVPVARTIPIGTQIAVVGFTRIGQPVRDKSGGLNSNWYQDASGNYLWAGATNTPVPPASGAAVPSAAAHHVLGKLSEKFETGGRGPGTVSSGAGDAGGASYGSYQMTSTGGGTVLKFVSRPDLPWRDQFRGLTPGSAEFTAKWKAIAAAEPEAFHGAQHAYIKATHFDVLVANVLDDDGLDVTTRSDALQDVVWSTAVQHGPNTPVIRRALAAVKGEAANAADPDFDRALIKAIYAERGRRDDAGGLVYFSKNSLDVQNGVAQRFVREEQDALRMLG